MEFVPKKGNPCILYDRKCTECGECQMCDLDPKKKCDNCGKCLEEMMPETDERGFVEILAEFETEKEPKEELNPELKALLKNYGLAEEDECCDDHCQHGDCDCGNDHHKDCNCNHEHTNSTHHHDGCGCKHNHNNK